MKNLMHRLALGALMLGWAAAGQAAPEGLAQDAAPAVPTAAPETPPQEPERTDTSFLLVRLTGDAKFVGIPAACVDPEPDVICMAEIYEAPARVIQNLGGIPTERSLNIRFTAHSFYAVWVKDVRFVLGVFPFEDKGRTGHFAYFWDWENEHGEFCQAADSLDQLDPSLRDFFASGRIRKAARRDSDWERGYKIACVKGRQGRPR